MCGLRVSGGIAQVVQRAAAPHREGVDSFVVSDALCFIAAEVVDPYIRLHSAAVALPRASVDRVRGVRQPLAIGTDGAVGAVGHRQRFGQSAGFLHRVQATSARDALHATGTEEQRTVSGPLVHQLCSWMVGDAFRRATNGRHDIDVTVAVIVANKRNLVPVR